MTTTVSPGPLSGFLNAPASKSITQRCYAAALLNHGYTTIYNPGHSNDDLAALAVIQQLGATVVQQNNDKIIISSNGVKPVSQEINCGESGLTARLFTPIAALSELPVIINGMGSLLTRPMDELTSILPQLNVSLSAHKATLPFTVNGPLVAATVTIDGSVSSQFLTGLLFALSYSAKEPFEINVTGLKSLPYVDLTLDVLTHFGREITNTNYSTFQIQPSRETNRSVEITVEGDWSSASFWLVAGAINGDVSVTGLNPLSHQADRAVLKALEEAGALITYTDNVLNVKTAPLLPFDFDATDCPDLFPILSILAAFCDGESYIKGLHRLFHKESNRVESIAEMLQQFDIPFSMEDDTLSIVGVERLSGGTIDSYNDHRIVMAAAIGATMAYAPVSITGSEAVKKSYPAFFEHLNFLGQQNVLIEL